jgi:2-polyprenyl-3-methyl-5-hydroxy-6-metoxy-1,4-benzoquinol methylase
VADPDVVAQWDAEAAVFDDEAHHSLEEPTMRAAWAEVLQSALPAPPAEVVDLGCGTGSLSVLLAEQGYAVTGIDVSPQMLDRARAKADAAGVTAWFELGDAAAPDLPATDVVLTRHVAWAVPDLDSAIGRWVAALRPGGRLVLVEGQWSNGAGIAAADLVAAVGRHLPDVTVEELDDPTLWGYELADSRYLLVARRTA